MSTPATQNLVSKYRCSIKKTKLVREIADSRAMSGKHKMNIDHLTPESKAFPKEQREHIKKT